MFLKSSTIFLLHLELNPKNGFKLKTGFDFRRSVSVRLTFWLQLYYIPGGRRCSVQMPIRGCAADMSRVFSNLGTFMGFKFPYFHWIFCNFGILMGCKWPTFGWMSAILVYWWVANSQIFAEKPDMKWYSHGSYLKISRGTPHPNSRVSTPPPLGGGGTTYKL